jgi:restriction endonuclease S subunit
LDENKTFLINRGKLESRFDSYYYNKQFLENEEKLNKIGYSKFYNFINIITKGSTPSMTNEGIPFLKVMNIDEFGFKTKNLDYISLKTHNAMKRSQLHGNEILYSMAGTIGIALNYNNKFKTANINQALSKILLNDTAKNQLIVYLLNSNLCKLQAKRFLTVSAQPNINFEQIKSIKIPQLSKSQESNIIDIMNNAYKLKKQKEKESKELLDSIDKYLLDKLGIVLPDEPENNIENRTFRVGFDKLYNNRFDNNYHKPYYQVMEENLSRSNFNIVRLIDILTFIECGSRPKGGVSNIKDGILSLGGEHVKENLQIDTTTKPKYILEEFHENILLTSLELNDILVVKDGATTGKIGIIKDNREVAQNINEHLFLLRFNNTCNKDFIASVLTSNFFQLLLKKEITGATVTGITKEAIKYLKIPLPNINIQNEIATEINQRRKEAKQLQNDAKTELEKAKKEVENIILGINNVKS